MRVGSYSWFIYILNIKTMIDNIMKISDKLINSGLWLYTISIVFLMVKFIIFLIRKKYFKEWRDIRKLGDSLFKYLIIYLLFFGVFVAIHRSVHCTYKGRCYPDPNIVAIFGIFISAVGNIIITLWASIYKKNRRLLLLLFLNPIIIGFISDLFIERFFQ